MSPSEEQLRAGDHDRRLVVSKLELAHGEGRISLVEFDERARLAWAAETFADLATLTADLPQASSRPAERSPDWPGAGGVLRVRGGCEVAWVFAVTINLVVWFLVSMGTGEAVYPWWIWVAGPWGAVLLVVRLTGPRRRAGWGSAAAAGRCSAGSAGSFARSCESAPRRTRLRAGRGSAFRPDSGPPGCRSRR